MSNATNNTSTGAHQNHWTATATKAGTYEFSTGGKFVDRNIDLVIPQAEETVTAAVSATVPVSVGTKSGTTYPFTGSKAITGTATATVNTKGFTDSASYSGTGITGNAGVSGSMNAIGLAASGSGSATIGTLTFTEGTNTYSITGSADITGTASASISSTGYGKAGVETGSGSVSGTASVSASVGKSVIEEGTTTTSSSVATRGTLEIGSGYYHQSRSISAAQFKNSETSGHTYVDISNTTDAPILISGDYLYINKGYVDDLKISLARLVPDLEGYTMGAAGDMLSGKTLYDKDGKPVTGTIGNSTTSKTDGTATATANTTHNLTSGTYTTAATTGYTYHVDATASASTTAASISASAGYLASAVNASTAAANSGNKSSKIYIIDSTSKVGTTAIASGGTINAGSTITISKGYYPTDRTFTAQSAGSALNTSNITGTLTTSITSGYAAPTLVNSTTSGVPYITITGNGSMTAGDIFSGTATAKTQYMEVYAGTYSVF